MRIIYGLIWLVVLNTCHAAEINCYSQKTRIYHGYGHDLYQNDGGILFTENKSNRQVLISADCVILEPFPWETK